MAEEPETVEVVAEETPASEVVEPPVVEAAAETPAEETATTETPAEQPKAEDVNPKAPKWARDRISDLAEERRRLRAENEAAQTELAAYRALLEGKAPAEGDETPPAKQTIPETEIERRAAEIAARTSAAEKFNAQCNTAYESGKAKYSDFDDALSQLGAAGIISPEDPSFLQAALATEAPHEVLYELSKDPEAARKLASLPPLQRAVQMDRMARDLATPKPKAISSAPAPVTPVKGAVKRDYSIDDPDIPMAEFERIRAKQREARMH